MRDRRARVHTVWWGRGTGSGNVGGKEERKMGENDDANVITNESDNIA